MIPTCASNDFCVYRLLAELFGRYPHFEFRTGMGLDLLGLGAAANARVRGLFVAAIAALPDRSASTFWRLGSAFLIEGQRRGKVTLEIQLNATVGEHETMALLYRS